MPGTTRMRLLLLSVCAIFLMGQQPRCDTQPPSIQCADFSLFVPSGTCVLFENPCRVDGRWLEPPRSDGFRIDERNRPASITVRTDRAGGVTTRAICAEPGALVVNESVVFLYGRGDAYGTGHLTLTSSSVLTVVASATPTTIDFGQSAQLVATVSGGVPPYSFNWVPTSGLSATNIPIPVASPSVTTMYNVTVVDSAGQPAHASVTVNVRFQLSVTANPSSIDAGDVSQLNASVHGGTLPYSFSWAPAASLDDPTIGDPLASPAVTTTYTVTVTDALGASLRGSVTVFVSDIRVRASASPSRVLAGESSQLSATVQGGTPPYSFSWAPAEGLDNPTSQNPVASPAVSTTYTVTVTDAAGVPPQASVFVQVPHLLIDTSASPGIIAAGESSQLSATVRGGTPPYSFSWAPAQSLNDPTRQNPVATPPVGTTRYTVTVTDATGVSLDRSVFVFVLVIVVDAFASPDTINPGGSSQLNATVRGGTPPYSFSWSSFSGSTESLDDPTRQNPIASPAVSTTYKVIVTDSAGASGGVVGPFVSVNALPPSSQADLAVTLVDSPDPVTVNTPLTLTMTVRNNSQTTATNVVLTGTLPPSLSVNSVVAEGPCTPPLAQITDTLTCNLGDIRGGRTVTVTLTASRSELGTITTTATVGADQTDPDTTNNTATQTTTVVQ